MNLLIIALAPVVAMIIFIAFNDRYEKEPVALLAIHFILGALVVIPILIVETLLNRLNIFSGLMWVFYSAFIVAGMTEEFFKRFVVLHIGYKSPHFNEKMDGIIYSVMVSLGFAAVENVMYVFGAEDMGLSVGVMRAIFSVPAHTLFGVTMGYYLSLSKYAETEISRATNLAKSFFIPMMLHGIFNFILMSQNQILMIGFIPYVIYLWKFNLKNLKQYRLESKQNAVKEKEAQGGDFDERS